jgi:hypothetical protein
MATIQIAPDNVHTRVWWMRWVELGDVIGRIIQDGDGSYQISPAGPHWSPMKSWAGLSFESKEMALAEVEKYFRGR